MSALPPGVVAVANIDAGHAKALPAVAILAESLRDQLLQLQVPVARLREPADCTSDTCLQHGAAEAAARYLVRGSLHVHDDFYVLELTLVDVASWAPLATVSNATSVEAGIETLEARLLLTQLIAPFAPSAERAWAASGSHPTSVAAEVAGDRTLSGAPPAAFARPPRTPPGDELCLSREDRRRYVTYREQVPNPLPVREWVALENEESWLVNLLWLTPPSMIILGNAAEGSGLATMGWILLPGAIVAAIMDARDVGHVHPCQPSVL